MVDTSNTRIRVAVAGVGAVLIGDDCATTVNGNDDLAFRVRGRWELSADAKRCLGSFERAAVLEACRQYVPEDAGALALASLGKFGGGR